MRTIVLRGLPVLLGDDPSNFYNTYFVSYSYILKEQYLTESDRTSTNSQ